MRFIKENPALAAGIGLPFLLVIFFTFSTVIMQWAVESPKYDAIFAIQDTNCLNGDAVVSFNFADGKVKARYSYPKVENNYRNCHANQSIYRFEAKNLTSRKITFELPEESEDSKTTSDWHKFEIAELANLQIDNSQVSPDGYNFKNKNGYYNGYFSPFFGGYRYRDSVVISKNGRNIKILPTDNRYYNYYAYDNVIFLGWVISDTGRKP